MHPPFRRGLYRICQGLKRMSYENCGCANADTIFLHRLGPNGLAVEDTTASWQGVPFTNVLNTPAWDLKVQAEWEASAVAGGQPITIASPINEQTLLNPGNPDGFSVFGSEVSNFMNLGYTWQGNFLVPPVW